MTLLEQLCREHLTHYAGAMSKRALEMGDDHCVRWYGIRVRDYVRAETGRAMDCNSPIYRRARTNLERMVRDGGAVAYRPGPGAYVFYWPIGLAEKLRAE